MKSKDEVQDMSRSEEQKKQKQTQISRDIRVGTIVHRSALEHDPQVCTHLLLLPTLIQIKGLVADSMETDIND
jgi:hypothetical protein